MTLAWVPRINVVNDKGLGIISDGNELVREGVYQVGLGNQDVK